MDDTLLVRGGGRATLRRSSIDAALPIFAFGSALAWCTTSSGRDVVQAFIAAWAALPNLAEPAAFPGWLRSIVHTAFRLLRRTGSAGRCDADAVERGRRRTGWSRGAPEPRRRSPRGAPMELRDPRRCLCTNAAPGHRDFLNLRSRRSATGCPPASA